jgi:hypothetical protein
MENILNQITNFYNHPLFIIVGGVTVTLAFIAFVYRLVCWTFGFYTPSLMFGGLRGNSGTQIRRKIYGPFCRRL